MGDFGVFVAWTRATGTSEINTICILYYINLHDKLLLVLLLLDRFGPVPTCSCDSGLHCGHFPA